MLAFPKRTLLAVGLPLGALALFGGSVAFAQTGGDGSSTTTPSQTPSPAPGGGAAPTSPTTPGTPRQHDPANCPNMGGSQSTQSGSSGSSTGTSFHRMRGPGASSNLQ